LLGNLLPGTLPGNPLLAKLFLETFFATFSWEPVPGREPVPGNLAWQLFLEPLLGNLAWEPVLGNPAWESFLATLLANLILGNLIGSLVLGVAEDWGKTFPSKFPGRGSQAGIQEEVPKQGSTVPKNGSQAKSQEPFPSTVPSRNKARRNRFPSKRSQEELVPKQNFQEQLGTLACEPLPGNLASEPLPSNLA